LVASRGVAARAVVVTAPGECEHGGGGQREQPAGGRGSGHGRGPFSGGVGRSRPNSRRREHPSGRPRGGCERGVLTSSGGATGVAGDHSGGVVEAHHRRSRCECRGGSVAPMELWLGEHRFDITHRAVVMGILNRTPDSFYDRGSYWGFDDFLAKADQLVVDGADFLDVGGVKAGPGDEVTEQEELDRV